MNLSRHEFTLTCMVDGNNAGEENQQEKFKLSKITQKFHLVQYLVGSSQNIDLGLRSSWCLICKQKFMLKRYWLKDPSASVELLISNDLSKVLSDALSINPFEKLSFQHANHHQPFRGIDFPIFHDANQD